MYPLPLPRRIYPLGPRQVSERRTWPNRSLHSLTRYKRKGLSHPAVHGRIKHLNQKTGVQGRLEKLLNGHNSSGGNSYKWKQCLTALHGYNLSFCGPAPESIPWLPLRQAHTLPSLKCLSLSGTLLTATIFPSLQRMVATTKY